MECCAWLPHLATIKKEIGYLALGEQLSTDQERENPEDTTYLY
jgi:hypothetical protein